MQLHLRILVQVGGNFDMLSNHLTDIWHLQEVVQENLARLGKAV